MSEGFFLSHLPPGWLGYGAAALFICYIVGQAIEKYEALAKVLPLGKWWHARQNAKIRPLSVHDVTKAVEEARHQWEVDGNSALTMLESQLKIIADVSRQQVRDIDALNDTMQALRGWSGYDARWHHKHEVDNASNSRHVVTPHLDFFEYEKLRRHNPDAIRNLL